MLQDDFFRKDQREAREPEPDQQQGERAAGDRGCFQLGRGLLFPGNFKNETRNNV